ncbi:MAG: ATPase domain-containing protein [Candidatus Alcyoniella australis]|nr:ATPase domain-containing protein [Candidatus Alcyoniella australis]
MDNSIKDPDSMVIDTGINTLNGLLDELSEDCKPRGIVLPGTDMAAGDPFWSWFNQGVTVLLKGPAGLGKSTLALEILSKAFLAKCDIKGQCLSDHVRDKGVCVYYSIEQALTPLIEVGRRMICEKLKGPKPKYAMLENYQLIAKSEGSIPLPDETEHRRLLFEKVVEDAQEQRVVLFPKLSPRFLEEGDQPADNVFWQRFKQISRLIEESRAGSKKLDRILAIVVDSLNVFSCNPLTREQLYRIFTLFSRHVPLSIFLYEQDQSSLDNGSSPLISDVEFLADIVITLDWDERSEYKVKIIEITKSRYQRHVFGKHPFKIRVDDPVFRIFVSMHHQIIQAKRRKQSEKEDQQNTSNSQGKSVVSFGISEIDKLIYDNADKRNAEEFERDGCIILEGERGTHKFAVAMNYLFDSVRNGKDAVVINLGERVDIKRIPQELDGRMTFTPPQRTIAQDKFEITAYTRGCKKGTLHILDFDPGFLLAEEFIGIFDEFIEKHPNIERVLFNSTAHLPLRFPLLHAERIFMPMLINYLKEKHIGSLFIAVNGPGADDQLLFGLRAMADIIIKLGIIDRTRYLVTPQNTVYLPKKWKTDIRQKAMTISVENITGKVYKKDWRLVFIEYCISDDPSQKPFNLLHLVPYTQKYIGRQPLLRRGVT